MRRPALLPALLALLAGCGVQQRGEMTANEVAAELKGLAIAPGLWDVASEVVAVRAPNLPIEARDRMIGPRRQHRTCLSPEEAARPSARFLAGRGDNGCVYADFAMGNGRMTGTMRCAEPEGGETLARMTGDYRLDSYRLDMTIETPLPDGATMEIETRTLGQRIGGCPARPAGE
ncbi:MAG: DUF3617 family protein [Sphingomonas sp.]|nr:DUF3617 family protein [Sphingomonas sp.]